MAEYTIQVKDLCVTFTQQRIKGSRFVEKEIEVLDKVSFSIPKGTSFGLVGESGCGKSVTAMSLIRLLPQPYGLIKSGSVLFEGEDLLKIPTQRLCQIRGNRISVIFQEPMNALNPVQSIAQQLLEIFQLHRTELSREEQERESLQLLDRVGIPNPKQRIKSYPHQLSGGMRQRVMIAMALACRPALLIADEPTTALDVTIQSQILDLIRELQQETGMSVLFITHDLGVVAEMCDEAGVMYAGRLVEQAEVQTLLNSPEHPYTRGLLRAMPTLQLEPKKPIQTIEGQVPSAENFQSGCRFYERCSFAQPHCRESRPPLQPKEEDVSHQIACFRSEEIRKMRGEEEGTGRER